MNTPATAIIHSATLVSGGERCADAWVAFAGDTIASRGVGSTWHELVTPRTSVTDADGRILTPGFIDIHCHGGGGAAFDDGAEAIRTGLAVHRAHGTTRTVLSLVTGTIEGLVTSLSAAAALGESDPLILGTHLEGPFLDNEFRGAHDPELLRAPDAQAIAALLDAARGTLRQITIAPEIPGSAEAIATLRAAGVHVAVGHSACDYEQASAAFGAGASILTHAFNGMRGIHHRAPGPVAAATHADHVVLEVINDGVHVHPEVVRMAFASAPGRIALITDAMAATGASDGDYLLGSLEVEVKAGVARLKSTGSIAGSTLTQDEALRRAVTEVGVPLEVAIEALTSTPARAIGRAGDLGLLQPGFAADAVLLSPELAVTAVWAAGIRLS